jgi:TonB family protein
MKGAIGWVLGLMGVAAVCPLPAAAEIDFTPPEVSRTVPPDYPFAMRRAGVSGRVVVAFVVDTRGRVHAPYVVESTHPGFRDSAIVAVEQWRFRPGTKEGRPINARMQVPIIFQIEGQPGNWGWRVERPKNFPESIPAHLRWDEAPRLENYNPPVYPRSALLEGRAETVQVGFLVGPTGRVVQTRVISGDHEDLRGAAVAAVHTFEFEPARRGGEPCGALLNMKFTFKRSSESDAEYTTETKRLLRLLGKRPERLVELSQLDELPKPLHRQSPVRPPHLRLAEPVTIEVEFIINQRGAAELPRFKGDVDPALGFAAVQAVDSWQFLPPRVDGKTVDARAVVPIIFQP